jgi:hypothetical protein
MADIKSKFISNLTLMYRESPVDGKWFKTTSELVFISSSGKTYIVPRYTSTDFASIPRLFRMILPRVGKYGKAAVLHDYLCESGTVDRIKADNLFLDAMEGLGVSRWKRNVMYITVSLYTRTIKTFKIRR